MAEACRQPHDNAGLQLGLQFAEGWRQGRDKICIDDTPGGFGLWAEQLIAESTGKLGKGLIPAPGESPARADRQRGEVKLGDAYDLGAEFFRWEFATAVAGAILGIDAFDQPNVQESKDNTKRLHEEYKSTGKMTVSGTQVKPDDPAVSALLAKVKPGDYVALTEYFAETPQRNKQIAEIREAIARALRVATTTGYGPRFLHSTGQLHKGGGDNGVFLQLTGGGGDDPGRSRGNSWQRGRDGERRAVLWSSRRGG